ncbi:conjugative transposon protein TraN [Bacteroides heparinolyticus]|uniref:conjugative transposon protein TraN n=1 Tax=Prevotella heparinolytica TaxID=28113 RepID=UPI0035A03F8E|nr:conjugative transposon protein TraN [Bacteroides heparinolyticus]
MKRLLFSLSIILSGALYAQSPYSVQNPFPVEEIRSSSFSVSTDKTFHLLFPTEVKYFSIGDSNVAGEKIAAYPNGIRLKSLIPFGGLTNMSVVTADGQYYSYNINFLSKLSESYLLVGKEYAIPPVISINDNQQSHFIFPEKIIYVDYGIAAVEVLKASGVDNILAVRAKESFASETNLTVLTQSGRFYTFDLVFADKPSHLSFVVDPAANAANKRVALLDNKELTSVQREALRKQVNSRFPTQNKLHKDYAGIRLAITNIFIDKDILFFKFQLTNYSNIDYIPDFVRFYIQDSKIRKKTAIQQIEQIPLFFFDLPERVSAHETKTFTAALNKFTIPDKKKLIIEMQEREGGRHFLYKLDNKPIISADILYPKREIRPIQSLYK